MGTLFVDRERELRVLEEAYASGKPELIVVYGRRRLGKTFLIRRFLRGRRGAYLVANYAERELALRDLSRQLSLATGIEASFQWLRDLLRFAARVLGERPVIVIDEFQRLAGTGLLGELQSFWDTEAHEHNPMIILVGSGVGVVERLALSYNSPIHGRVTRVLRLGGFGYREARVFMEGWGPVDRVRGYSVFGGTPYYLSLIDASRSLTENITKLVLEPGAPLHEEPLSILYAETREPDRYMAVLEAIARGYERPSEIASYVGVPRDSIGKYLRVLEEALGLVERTYPLGMEGRPRYARYRIVDWFFSWWFSEVYPFRSLLELDPEKAAGRILARLDLHAARAWEQVAMEHMLLLRRRGALGFTKIGRWWWRGTEIDIVAVDEDTGTAIFAECKWGRADRRTLTQLMAKAQQFPWRRGERREVYIIYAGSVESLPETPGVHVYTVDRVDEDFAAEPPPVGEA